MHTNKRLVQVEDADDGSLILKFKDGSKEYADLLVGADGVHGYVREHILGADHPALKPVFAGFWDCRTLVPFEKAKEVLGEEYFKEHRRYVWSGGKPLARPPLCRSKKYFGLRLEAVSQNLAYQMLPRTSTNFITPCRWWHVYA